MVTTISGRNPLKRDGQQSKGFLMDNKIITFGFAGIIIAAFIAGFLAYNSLSCKIDLQVAGKTAIIDKQIRDIETKNTELSKELRNKADVAVAASIDARFERIAYDISEIKDRLARMETSIKYISERKN